MLDSLLINIECPVCKVPLSYDYDSTYDAYSEIFDYEPKDLDTLIDKEIFKFLVYKCPICDGEFRFTYKKIEKFKRMELTNKLAVLINRGLLNNYNAVKDTVYIYCGKCGGFDGSGACPRFVYDNCEIKRFPADVI